ncbi:MAG: hypothetical protein HYS32_03325 [Candidatus Woesearchaeota archaeon]|nr:MAG: hypothetical protein HYS32_03325 [Candidatus Woesearchaeota archaeon]
MKKINKLLLLFLLELILVFIFLALSDTFQLIATIIFPPIFGVTVFLLITTLIEAYHPQKDIKKFYFIFAFLLASVALFSSGVGFHFASNDINNAFLTNQPNLQDRLNFLDEIFSHYIIIAGIILMALAFLTWAFFRTKENIETHRKELVTESNLMDLFITSFLGTLVGTIGSIASIEANVLIYGVSAIVLVIPMILIFYKSHKMSAIARDWVVFMFTGVSSYLAVSVAYTIITKASFLLKFII